MGNWKWRIPFYSYRVIVLPTICPCHLRTSMYLLSHLSYIENFFFFFLRLLFILVLHFTSAGAVFQ